MTDLHPSTSPRSDEVERAVELDASLEAVRDALSDPELLAAWLGPWTEDGSGTTVQTDDGVVRRVTDRRVHADGVEWRWHDEGDTDAASTVRITLEPLAGGTRLVVRETACSATTASVAATTRERSVVLDPATWLANLLALGAVLAASSLVRV
jgi:uncharacterized protein YndB with AHSA1/START domain